MKLALIQTDPKPGKLKSNLQSGFDQLARAKDADADLAILPEMWPRSYTDALDVRADGPDWQAVLNQWQSTCAELKLPSIGGLPRHVGNDLHNTLYWINSHGQIQTQYDKLHMFSFMNEQKRFKPGNEIVTSTFQGLKFGLAICYDLRFPELYRLLRQAGADVLITIAQWPTARREHWQNQLRARAIENLCFSVGVNRRGIVKTDKQSIEFPGASAVISPWGETLCELDAHTEIRIVEIDPAQIQQHRDKFSSWGDRRFNLTDRLR